MTLHLFVARGRARFELLQLPESRQCKRQQHGAIGALQVGPGGERMWGKRGNRATTMFD